MYEQIRIWTILLVIMVVSTCLGWAGTGDISEAEQALLQGEISPVKISQLPMTDDFFPGDFVVTDAVTDGAYRVTSTGTVEVLHVGSPLDGATGVVVDQMGNIIVGNESLRTVYKIDPLGNVSFLADVSTFGMSLLADIDLDVNGDYIVVGTSHIIRITPDGTASLDYSGTPLASLQAICIDPSTGDMYLGGSSTNIWKRDTAGNITTFYSGSPLMLVEGLEMDLFGNIIVADETADAVFRIDPTGAISTVASGLPINAPEDVCIDAEGNYVISCDPSIDEVYKVSPSGAVTFFASYSSWSALDGIAFYESLVTYDVTVTLTPYGTPIIIPSGGGSFSFNLEVTNNESFAVTFGAWCMVTLPNGTIYGPILGPADLNLPGTWSINRDRDQAVPGGAPAGNYTYHAYVGQYPNNIWDEDQFQFEKEASDGSAYVIGDWYCSGESFEEIDCRIKAVESNHPIEVSPNPFNPVTSLSFNLPVAERVDLSVYDINGRLVAELIDGWREAGYQEVTFDASELASGLYVYRLQVGEQIHSGKMVFMK